MPETQGTRAGASARVEWIDICKGLGILLVVLGHNRVFVEAEPALYQILFLFHVPLFFFVTGLTLKPYAPFATQWRRIAALIVPYFVFSLALLPVFWRDPAQQGVTLASFLLGTLYGTGLTIYDMPLWFLPCLAVALAIVGVVTMPFAAGALARIRSTVLIAVAIALLLGGGAVLMHSHGLLAARVGWGSIERAGPWWSADVALIAAGFILLGALAAPRLIARRWPAWLLVACFVCGVLSLVLAQRAGLQTDLNLRVFAPAWEHALIALLGIGAALALAQLIEYSAWLKQPFIWAGQSSLVVLWLHGVFQHKGIQLFSRSRHGAPLWLASVLVAVAVPVLIDRWIIRRYALGRVLTYPKFARRGAER